MGHRPARDYWPATLAGALLTAGLLSALHADPTPVQVPPPAPATRAVAPAPEPSPSATAGTTTPLRVPAVALPSPDPDPWPSPIPPPPPATVPEPWYSLAGCESGRDWTEGDGGLGPFRGGLQWHPDTWAAVKPAGAPDDPADATRWQEVAAAEALLDEPWGSLEHWPTCARQLGLIP